MFFSPARTQSCRDAVAGRLTSDACSQTHDQAEAGTFVGKMVLRLQGIADAIPRSFTLRADFDWLRPDARAEFLRGRMNYTGGVELYPNQGAGVVVSLGGAQVSFGKRFAAAALSGVTTLALTGGSMFMTMVDTATSEA